MKRLSLNVDLGERGVGHPVDLTLLERADLANVACGGHAGSADGRQAFWAKEAAVRGVGITGTSRTRTGSTSAGGRWRCRSRSWRSRWRSSGRCCRGWTR